jgi:hypothetical protein
MKNLFLLGLLAFTQPVFSQCQILNRIYPDGSMLYYMKPVNFYWTKTKSLTGCIVTDKENYFLELHPVPFPEKPAGNKLKEDLELKLSDGTIFKLSHYDTHYSENDSVMEMLYIIDKKEISNFQRFNVEQVTVNMMGDEGKRTYVFKLHKTALKEQLDCFLKDEEPKEKK